MSHVFDQRLGAQEQALIATAKTFARDMRKRLRTPTADGLVAPELYVEAARAGLAAVQVAPSYGGHGFGFRCKMRVAEELAKASMPFSFSLINTHNAAAKLAQFASAELASAWLPKLLSCSAFGATALTEPHTGSDFAAITTNATKTAEGWQLSGAKAWITNAAFADIFVTYAQTDPSLGWRGIACFAVDANAAGFIRSAPFALFGGNGIGAGGFVLENSFVPDTALIHPPGEAFKAALGSINGARTYVAAMCCAILQDALDTAIAYGRERQAFGKRLLDNQGLRWLLADATTELEAMRALTYKAAELVEINSPEAVIAAAHAKKYAARIAQTRILDCIQAMGANGMLVEHGLGEHLAHAKIANYVDGSTEIQNERIAAILFD
jgi:alkylation response protein AidB-like acyl-CoA dehydrogenase